MELSWEKKEWFLAVKSFTILPDYPRKIKYFQNIFKTCLKKTIFFVIEAKICLGLLLKIWLWTEITRTFVLLAIWKIINETNLTTPVIKSLLTFNAYSISQSTR